LRFVTIKLDPKTVRAMFSRNAAGATLLIDRHHTSLESYRQRQPNLCKPAAPLAMFRLRGTIWC
jgi:hypothetical protein